MLFLFYDCLFIILFLAYIPFLTFKKKWHAGYWQRLGFVSKKLKERLKGDKNIWIHAVSVGEILAIVDLIEKLNKQYPGYKIVCSTVTKTGYKIASERLSDVAVVFFAPLDFSWLTRFFIRLIDPRVYIATETEIWPNLYIALNKHQVPIVQINGRISDKGFKGYQRFRFLTKYILRRVDCFLMQSKLDAQRILELGAYQERIRVIGNIKFDNLPKPDFKQLEKFPFANDFIIIGGSTHLGEEEILLNVYKRLFETNPNIRLILAPRHVERAKEVLAIVNQLGFQGVLFSESLEQTYSTQTVIVVDQIGELRNLYFLAQIVFIGKTLKVGGAQNMIEPASFAKAVFVGPMTYNFRDVVDIFLKEGAIIQVQNENELFEKMLEAIRKPDILVSVGEAAGRIVSEYGGATQKTLEVIASLINDPRYYDKKITRNKFKQFVYEVITDKQKDFSGKFVKLILWVLSIIYWLVISTVKFLYRVNIFKQNKLPATVISVGNLTWGGVGKTPFVEVLIEFLKEQNQKPAILMRGFMVDKKAQKAGLSDEAKMLEENLSDTPVIVGANRFQSGQDFLAKNKASLFVLDDGFQHQKLYRDLDIILMDATNPWGSGDLIPCGILREPLASLSRAAIIVLTKTNLNYAGLKLIRNKINEINPSALVVESVHEPKHLKDLRNNKIVELNYLMGKRICSFCSIGDPQSFTETLKLLEANNAYTFEFLDHHLYTQNDIVWINQFCQDNHIKILVMTQKDQVKLNDLLQYFDNDIVILSLEMKLLIIRGKEEFLERINHLLLS